VPGVLVAVSKVHPSRNRLLRDKTFRPVPTKYYRVKRVSFPAVFLPGVLIAISRVHPSRNIRLRDETFRQQGHRRARKYSGVALTSAFVETPYNIIELDTTVNVTELDTAVNVTELDTTIHVLEEK
jgi:hypothetical protein